MRYDDVIEGDEVINVTMTKKEFITLREMIKERQAWGWLKKYLFTGLLAAVGGILTFSVFLEKLRIWLGVFVKGT